MVGSQAVSIEAQLAAARLSPEELGGNMDVHFPAADNGQTRAGLLELLARTDLGGGVAFGPNAPENLRAMRQEWYRRAGQVLFGPDGVEVKFAGDGE